MEELYELLAKTILFYLGASLLWLLLHRSKMRFAAYLKHRADEWDGIFGFVVLVAVISTGVWGFI